MTLRHRRDPHLLSPAFITRNACAYGFATIVSLLLITRIDFEPLNVAQDWGAGLVYLAFFMKRFGDVIHDSKNKIFGCYHRQREPGSRADNNLGKCYNERRRQAWIARHDEKRP
jgi:hypothetical protein